MCEINAEYISVSCNRTPKALDWGGNDNRIIFSFTNSIGLLTNTEPYQIKTTFNKHKERVNCVKWIQNSNNSSLNYSEFVSASTDKTICVWKGCNNEYEEIDHLNGHKDTVSVLDAIYHLNNKVVNTYICSASVDSTVAIWNRSDLNESFKQTQSMYCKSKGFALTIKFYLLPIVDLPGLFIGYENHKIEIYAPKIDENKIEQFHHVHTLIGHEDWIRDIDVCRTNDRQLMIVSCAQDCYIRVWKMSAIEIESTSTSQISDANSESEVDDEDEDYEGKHDNTEIKLKSTLFRVSFGKKNRCVEFTVNLDSVLYGHEDWVYSVKWHPLINNKQPLTFISSSIDKTIVIWKYDEQNSLWLDMVRAGDIGGNTLGFFGALFDPNGEYIVAHGFQGALHAWKRNKNSENQNEALTPAIISSGHFNNVEDICWEPQQQFFLSVSKDQTTRFHGYWSKSGSWHEFGRPQIHGYDMQCVSFIDRFKFVSGADEKLLRIFEAPKIFLRNYLNLNENDKDVYKLLNSQDIPEGASVPALGLSNKAVFEVDKQTATVEPESVRIAEELYKEVYFNVVDLKKPPTEEHLLQNTLWPEMQKLYGHSYEIFACATHPNGSIIASACKATKAEYATIIIWQLDTTRKSYHQICSLMSHELTIVQLAFSNDGNYLLSVSRDRSWKLFKFTNDPQQLYVLYRSISSKNTQHTRIIWSCAWSFDDAYFITTSRDKRVCVWNGIKEERQEDTNEQAIAILELNDSVTACSIAPTKVGDSYLMAFGMESGLIELYLWNIKEGFKPHSNVPIKYSHSLTVKRLSFRKLFDKDEAKKQLKFYLLSCSDDSSVRLFSIKTNA